jgi:hypothetical protein
VVGVMMVKPDLVKGRHELLAGHGQCFHLQLPLCQCVVVILKHDPGAFGCVIAPGCASQA